MLDWVGDGTRFLRRLWQQDRQPHHLALGISLGVALGLLPKANLIALGLVFAIFALRTHLVASFAVTLVCSWISLLVDPLLGMLGRVILNLGALQGFWVSLYELPFVPWTCFNNTVVMGALCVAILQAYPTYRLARRHFESRRVRQADWRVRPSGPPTGSLSGVWRIG